MSAYVQKDHVLTIFVCKKSKIWTGNIHS